MSNSLSSLENRFLQHHFVSSDQQFEASKLGMWLFLVTEILFFGGLFVAYIVFRAAHPELYILASEQLDVMLGGINTGVLILSSLTVALAIHSAQVDDNKGIFRYLIITILLALVFMVIKYFEYSHKFEIGIYPGALYTFDGIDHPQSGVFFSIYYMMTGVHGLHVIVGIGLMVWLLFRVQKKHFGSAYYTPVEIVGLYWHLVDIIWIFLFPLLYLID